MGFVIAIRKVAGLPREFPKRFQYYQPFLVDPHGILLAVLLQLELLIWKLIFCCFLWSYKVIHSPGLFFIRKLYQFAFVPLE